ncbi:hypothetical protein Hanom_Chr16g01506821 [Helianthus anomalus]
MIFSSVEAKHPEHNDRTGVIERKRGVAMMEEPAVVSRQPPSWSSVRLVVGCGGLDA